MNSVSTQNFDTQRKKSSSIILDDGETNGLINRASRFRGVTHVMRTSKGVTTVLNQVLIPITLTS
ncbi:MAG: hypothetical protein HC903_18495 [Methylacidiphilales bacterium]|nr:hypothetical protein [Candidatus Methylacidiphilales bacterium]NJR17989.1 hypothetical protein [Calothrix sp. CSU_2_0]